ncbi:MAG: sulfite exporter TauE/SafE family protein [Haloarculaceae archaeon]
MSCSPANPLLATETVGLPIFFLIGLLGGAHCLGMCGPLVATYAERMGPSGRHRSRLTLRQVRQQTLFNLGCIVAGSVLPQFNRSLTDFREIDGELDAVVRYEVETTDRTTV